MIKEALSADDIERLVKEAEKYKDEDKHIKENLQAKNNLEEFVYQTESSVNDNTKNNALSEDEKTEIINGISEIKSWLNENRTTEEYEEKHLNFNKD